MPEEHGVLGDMASLWGDNLGITSVSMVQIIESGKLSSVTGDVIPLPCGDLENIMSLLGDLPVSVVLTTKLREIPRVSLSMPSLPSFLSCTSQIVDGR